MGVAPHEWKKELTRRRRQRTRSPTENQMTDQNDNLPNEALDDAPGKLDFDAVGYDPTPLSFDEFDQQTSASAETERVALPERSIDVDSASVSLAAAAAIPDSKDAPATDGENATEANSSVDVELSQFLSPDQDGDVKIDLHIESSAKDGKSGRKKKRPRPNVERATQPAKTPAPVPTRTVAPPTPKPVATPQSAPPQKPKPTAPPPEPVRFDLPDPQPPKPYEFANPLKNGLQPRPQLARLRADDVEDDVEDDAEEKKKESDGIGGCLCVIVVVSTIFLILSPKSAATLVPIAMIIGIGFLLSKSFNKSL